MLESISLRESWRCDEVPVPEGAPKLQRDFAVWMLEIISLRESWRCDEVPVPEGVSKLQRDLSAHL